MKGLFNNILNDSRLFVKSVILLCVIGGCDQYLDVAPDNRVALDDLDKAAQLLTNAYSVASPAFTDWMTDDFAYSPGTVIRPTHERLFQWQETFSSPDEQDSPEFFWYQTYNAIGHANEVLNILDELPEESERDEAYKRAIEGEALLVRAYGHFMLVNMFGKAYNFDLTSRDRGVPYIKTPETTFLAEYERLSVERTYDEIEDDLLDGLDLIDDSFYNNSGKYHFNRNAALAFASRYYLYKRDFVRCLQYSNELLGSNASAYVRDFTSDEYQNAKSSITGYPQLYSSPDEPANFLLMRKISLVQRTDFAYGIEQNFYGDLYGTNPFGATDERENPAFVKGENALFPVRYESLFERSSINSNVGTPYHIGIMFRGEEVLLNRIEALAWQGRVDEAIADLQILTDKRYTGEEAILTMERIKNFFPFSNSDELPDWVFVLEYVLFERRKEFIGQGMRWFDIKRFGFEVDHVLPNGDTVTLTEDDPRKVLQIPLSAQDLGGLEPNDR